MRPKESLLAQLPSLGLPALLLATLAFFSLLMPDKFLSWSTFTSMAFQMPELGLLTLAMFLPFVSAGFNLAIIVTANLCSLLMAWMWVCFIPVDAGVAQQLIWLVVAFASACVLAAVIGAGIGTMVAYAGIHPTLATLGVMTLIKGIGIAVTGGRPIRGMPAVIQFIGNNAVLGIPMPLVVFLLTAAAIAVLLGKTQFGKNVYMVGSNINATYYSGVDTHRVLIAIYICSSLLCVAAGLVMTARFNSANMGYGDSYLLLTVLAIIMGGADPNGGFGKVWGAVLALLILQIISTGLNLYGVSQHVSLAMWGIVLIFTLAVKYCARRWYTPWSQRRQTAKSAE